MVCWDVHRSPARAALLALAGCAPAYHPAALHPTMFDDGKQVSAMGQIAVSGVHLAAAYAPVRRFAVRGRFQARPPPWDDRYWLAGLGIETFDAPRGPLRVALGLEFAAGRVDASDEWTPLFSRSAVRYEAHGALIQGAIPATLGWAYRDVQLGVTGRFVAHTLINDLQWTGQTRGTLFGGEAAFFFRAGRTVKLDGQVGLAFVRPTGDVPADFLPLIAGLGIVVDLDLARDR